MPYRFSSSYNGYCYWFYFRGINNNTSDENLNIPSVKVRENEGWAEWHVSCSDPAVDRNTMSQYVSEIQGAFLTGFNKQNFDSTTHYNSDHYNHYVTDVIQYSRLCKKTHVSTNSFSSSEPESLDTI